MSPLLQSASRPVLQPYRPKGNGEWKALLSALFGLLVLGGIVAGGFYLFSRMPKMGKGTLSIVVDDGAERKYAESRYRLLISDSKGERVKTLLDKERKLVLAPGDYSAELDGPPGLLLQVTDWNEKGRKLNFKVDSGGEVKLKVLSTSTPAPDSKPDSKSESKTD